MRCEEIRNNPGKYIPEFFLNGWFGADSLKRFYQNYNLYKKSEGRTRQLLDEGQLSDSDYILAAEQAFLYGKAGRQVIIDSAKAYFNIKLRGTHVKEYSDKLVEIKDELEIVGRPFVAECCVEKVSERHYEERIIEEPEDFLSRVKDFDKEHVWMFDAGNYGRSDFRGNPKYLFVYINKYRKDIFAYWYGEPTAVSAIKQVRKLGYCGVLQDTKEANILLKHTGVVVSEMVREFIPVPLMNAKYLNLWHGIGFKRIERGIQLDASDLRLGIAKKYIMDNSYYLNNQLLSVSSPIYEKEFSEDLGVTSDQMIKTGYLRCLYQHNYEPIATYDHDILKREGLCDNYKIAVYAPTYRANRGDSFATGMINLDKLYKCCKENNILFIFKPHQYIEMENAFKTAAAYYANSPYFLFWDNTNDFYEVIDKVDLVIYDYSSMFSDFLCAGVKHFIRYIYDEEDYMADGFTQGKEAYYERTCGITCHTFDEMLDALANYENIDMSEETNQVYERLWAYAGENDFEKTIEATLEFKPKNIEYPTLYSFDVFDTLISRKGLMPYSIFYKVAENMRTEVDYPLDFINRYPIIRHSAEMNVRDYYKKTTQTRHSEKVEIQMDEIFERLKDVYNISEAQSRQLMEWEIEEEIKSVVPVCENIDKVKSLVESGETVVLISDMYLPKRVISKMLAKADHALAALPLFVSSDYGVQKTTRLLYFEAYKSFKPFYKFGKWIHYGDNAAADRAPARQLGISTVIVDKPKLNDVENKLLEKLNSYDAYLVAALCARLRNKMKNKFAKADFVTDVVGLTLIPYVDLVIRDALNRGFEVLYFVARDGHFLKMIADELIKANSWNIETKYLFSSRRTWRVQSYFDEIDETFWIEQGGNFNDIHAKEYMLKALYIDEDSFKKTCPQIDLDSVDWSEEQPGRNLASIIRKSVEYNKYLLDKARELRELPCKYLEQELYTDRKIAFVEYWGRGYNQSCMTKLWSYVTGKEETSYYYYARSILPSDEHNKHIDMTDLDVNISLFEAVFANMPYTSIEEYEEVDGKIQPIINNNKYFDKSLFEAMEAILPVMAKKYAEVEYIHPEDFSHSLFDFSLEYTFENRQLPLIAESIGNLRDSMSMYGKIDEYAPAYTMKDLDDFSNGKARGDDTLSIQMSYGRASDRVKERYNAMYQVEPGEDPFKSPMLSRTEIVNNSKYQKMYEDASERAYRAKEFYYEACKKNKVFNKVTIVSTSKDFSNDVLYSLHKIFDYNQDFMVEWLTSSRSTDMDEELMRQIAMAKVVIMDGNVVQLLKVKFRPETTCISLLDRGFRLYKFGRNENVKLKKQLLYDTLMHTRTPDVIEVTSNECLENSGYTMNSEMMTKLQGACVTDVLFDPDFKKNALEKLHMIVPESVDKKLIVYMPSPRRRKSSGKCLELLDIEYLAKCLNGEYYMFVDFRSNNALADTAENIIEVPGFSKNVSKEKITLRSLLVSADIVIGDYRDTFFEAALLKIPVYSTAFDMGDIQSSSSNLIYDMYKIYPFPVIKDAESLIKILDKNYDFLLIHNFIDNYLMGCDGNASERLGLYVKKKLMR